MRRRLIAGAPRRSGRRKRRTRPDRRPHSPHAQLARSLATDPADGRASIPQRGCSRAGQQHQSISKRLNPHAVSDLAPRPITECASGNLGVLEVLSETYHSPITIRVIGYAQRASPQRILPLRS
jgi:hypothetical protein